MAKFTFRQKVIIAAALTGSSSGNVPGGNPEIDAEFTFIIAENGKLLTTELSNPLETESGQN